MSRRAPALLLVLALAGCSSGGGSDAVATGLAGPSGGDPALLSEYGEELPTGPGTSGGGSTGLTYGRDAATLDSAAAPAAAGAAPRGESPPEVPAGGALRAGSVDDNARFEEFLAYRERTAARVGADPLDVSERHVVTVRDRDGRPVLGARVSLRDGDRELQAARTHADGRALLFPLVTEAPDVSDYDLVVTYGDATVEGEIADRAVRSHDLALDVARADGPARLDLHFLLDTTGSMGDELDRLRDTLGEVAQSIEALPSEPVVRYGLTVYKDADDAYVSKTHDFTDLATFREKLSEVSADGGGDTPEALDEALHGAVSGPQWDSDRAVQLAFLVADASPHLGPGSGPSYAKDVQVAAEKGIEVVPLASSGTDDAAEHVFRQLAQYSLGTFFFLTYGADGRSPGDGTDLDVSGFETGSLDELVVRHVSDRLAALDGRGPGQ